MKTQIREYSKKWISSKQLNEMSITELEQFLSNNSVQILFTNYKTNDLKELCYENNLVKSFETRGRNKKTMTKFMLLKLCQKFIAENNSEQIFETNGTVTFTICKNS